MRLKKYCTIILLMACCQHLLAQHSTQPPLKIWYKQPAQRWMQQALPIGNGKIGAMIFGGVDVEHIQFNEKSVWSGSVNKNENKAVMAAMPQIQNLLANGEIESADSIYKNAGYLQFNGAAPRENFGAYQPFGDIKIRFKNAEGAVTNYTRELTITNGAASVKYAVNGVDYSRTFFCSYPDQVMVVQLTASRQGELSVELEGAMPAAKNGVIRLDKGDIVYSGKMMESGLLYEARLRVMSDGKKSFSGIKGITVDKARFITIILSANTNHRMQWPDVISNINPAKICLQQIDSAAKKTYKKLLQTHTADHTNFFSKVSFQLHDSGKSDRLPTDERLRNYTANNKINKGGNDVGLEALLFQYGRYLLIASSRGNSLPANLQGIWNDSPTPAWDSDYHTDINLQMTYWPTGPANLGNCFKPLLNYIQFLQKPGSITAKEYFGTNGFFIQTYTNPWGYAAPRWLWTGAAGWLCQNQYDHFLFSGNYNYLKKEAYPIMKEACRFYMGVLRPYKNGGLAVVPSNSPEVNFVAADNKDYRYSAGAAIDQQIVHDLFTNTIEAASVLHIDQPFSDTLTTLLNQLSPPVKLAFDGTLQEWIEPWKALDTTHRHLSHLYALYPGRLINPADTLLANAAAKTILKRGYGYTEWATTWRMLFWARLHQPKEVYQLFKFFISRSTNEGVEYFNAPGSVGVYDNLLAAHSPFQVDGNMGFTAAVAEMLMQSHIGNLKDGYEIELLPALPAAWKAGSITGLKGRGAVEASITWKNNQLVRVILKTVETKHLTVKYGRKKISLRLIKEKPLTLDEKLRIIK